MSRFLLASHPATGHLNPLLSIARRLCDNGHEAIFSTYGPKAVQKRIVDHGFACRTVRPAVTGFCLFFLSRLSGWTETAFAARVMLSSSAHYASQYKPLLEELQPDAVVSEFAFYGPCLAAESRKTPCAIVYHAGLSLAGPGIPPYGSGLPIGTPQTEWPSGLLRASEWLEQSVDASIQGARERLGLPPGHEKHYLRRCPARWLNLTLTTEASEAPRFEPPPTTFFVGPCTTGRQSDELAFEENADGSLASQPVWPPLAQLSPDLPAVYVSLGTVFNNKPKVFRKIIDAFDRRHQVIVSAGGAFDALKAQALPNNILLFQRVPQIEVLGHVDVVVSHGGNNTVNETLTAGKPLLVLPVGGEQGDNASRVTHLGVGLRADINQFDPAEVRSKIDRLLHESHFGERARDIAEIISRTDGPGTSARFIAHIAQTREPLRRPPGYPLTVTRDTPPPWEWEETSGGV